MKEKIETNQELLSKEQKDKQLTELFNQCIQMMDMHYRKKHPVITQVPSNKGEAQWQSQHLH